MQNAVEWKHLRHVEQRCNELCIDTEAAIFGYDVHLIFTV